MVYKHSTKKIIKPNTPDFKERRTQSYFAFLPIRIGDETRWFETVTVEQEYNCGDAAICIYYVWTNIKFKD